MVLSERFPSRFTTKQTIFVSGSARGWILYPGTLNDLTNS